VVFQTTSRLKNGFCLLSRFQRHFLSVTLRW